MAANPAYMHGFDEQEAVQSSARRTWASTVPYDLISSDGAVIDVPAGGQRARMSGQQASRPTAATTTYRPSRQTAALPYEQEDWRPPAAQPPSGRIYESSPALLSRSNARMGLYAVLAAVAVVVLYVVVSSVVHWTQIRMDDIAYGRPRTTHLEAVVGHGDSAAQPTHFIAVNLNRQVSIIEIPAGDISKSVAISGPYLFGEEEDLTPAKMQLTDLNGDGKLDLLLDVKSEQMAYINDNNAFRPITAEEKAQIDASSIQSSAAGK